MMESVEELERKLLMAKEIEKVRNYFDTAECPICGGKGIRVTITISGSESMMWGSATVKCEHCGMLNYEHKINGYDAYHWNYNGVPN